MLTPDLNRRSCLSRAQDWHRQAGHVHEHAQLRHLRPEQREMLLREAEACDRLAAWWLAGAEDYAPDATGAEPEGPRP